MTSGMGAPPGEQLVTSKDGCRIRPADDCIGKDVDCSNLHLDHIPDDLPVDMRKLTMRHNSLIRLSDYSLNKYEVLTSLDLSRNNLRVFGVHAFSGLSQLVNIDLTYNHLCLDTDTYPVGLFRGMTSLRRLTMTSNTCKTQHVAYPDETLADLSNLEFLSLTGIPTTQLGEGFRRLTNLKTLAFTGHGCKMPVLSNTTFISLTDVRLTHLCIKACELKKIEPGALKPLSHLTTLNMACNEYVEFTAIHAAIAAANDTRLTTLVVDDVTPSGWLMDRAHFAHIALTSIERLSMRANDIIAVDVRLFRPLKNLRHINVGFNSGTTFEPPINRTAVVIDVLVALNIDVADVSQYFGRRNAYRHRYCYREKKSSTEDPTDPTEYFFREPPAFRDLDFSRPLPPKKTCHAGRTNAEQKHCHAIPPSVQVIYADNVTSEDKTHRRIEVAINVSADNDVVVLNVSHNPTFTSIGPIHGLRRCQVIDISHCKIAAMLAAAFSDLPMLRYLFMSDNNIGEKGADLQGVFDGSSTIEVLDLSRNAISHIHVSAFSSLLNLRTLALSGNRLTSVGFDISALHRLTSLNLARNKILQFNRTTSPSNTSCVYVDLFRNPVNVQNPFRCPTPDVADETARCTTSTSTQYPALVTGDTTPQHSLNDTDNKPSSADHKPKSLVIYVVVVGVLTVGVVVVVIVVVVCRTRLRHWWRATLGGRDYGHVPIDDEVALSLTTDQSNDGMTPTVSTETLR